MKPEAPKPQRLTVLPPRVKRFYGRAIELQLFAMSSRERTSPPVWIVHGSLGSGTSALAREAVERAYESGASVAWVDCADPFGRLESWQRAVSATRHWSAGSVLSTVLAYGRKGFEEREGRWLLVFDGVHDPADITAMIPRKGSGTVIVTTHADPRAWRFVERNEPLAIDTAPVPLEALSPGETAAWLRDACGDKCASREAEVARLCAGKPLAVELVARRARRLKEGLALVARRMNEDATGDPVADALDVALRGTASVPGSWGLLAWLSSLAEAPVPDVLAEAFGRLTELDPERAAGARRRLLASGLVARQSDGLVVHPAVRARVREEMEDDLWTGCVQLGFEALGAISAKALREHSTDDVPGLLPHFVAWARNAHRDAAAADVITAFLVPAAGWLESHSLWEPAADTYAECVPALRRLADSEGATAGLGDQCVKALLGLGRTAAQAQRPEVAREAITEALARHEKLHGARPDVEVAQMHHELGVAASERRDREASNAHHERAYAMADALGEGGRAVAADAAKALAWNARLADATDAECAWLRREIAHVDATGGDAPRSLEARRRLAAQLAAGGHAEEAEAEALAAVGAARKLANERPMESCYALWTLGDVHAKAARHREAASAFMGAAALHARHGGGLVRERGSLLWLAAESFEAAGDPVAALAAYEGAVVIYRSVRDADHPAIALCRLGRARVLRSLGRVTEALASWNEAVEGVGSFMQLDGYEPGAEERAYLERARLARAQGDLAGALGWLDRLRTARAAWRPPPRELFAEAALERAEVLRAQGLEADAQAALYDGLEAAAEHLGATHARVVALRAALGENPHAAAN